ncbi:MAG: tRNA 2-thiouridine(34) synthase MnmA [Lentisphaeria bacterium]|nr:tRNA 2-thiouridine(34) synthase MnmA [Lentisphaeria bacterium]
MKVAVLISGGVDSSVALRRMVDEGHEVTAFYLKIWLEDELAFLGECPWEEDLDYVRQVCEQVNVPLEVLPLQKEYWDRVVSYTIAELQEGRTPSPDIFCNQRVKFGAFFEKISDEFDYIASGHYAQVEHGEDGSRLLKAPDPVKDQTYFLSHLSQEQLQKILFPIGDLLKREVRELAESYDLPNKKRKDSQGICFLGKIKYPDFVKYHLGEKDGDIIEFETGKKLGTHNGIWFYTIGQRQGIGLHGGPWYVVDKNMDSNTIAISNNRNANPAALDQFIMKAPNWVHHEPVNGSYDVKLRHGPKTIQATIEKLNPSSWQVKLIESDGGLADGQFCIIYDKNECLGGGMIQTQHDNLN